MHFAKNATYIKTNFQIKKGPLQNLSARKSTLSGLHIPVPTFPLSTPPGQKSHVQHHTNIQMRNKTQKCKNIGTLPSKFWIISKFSIFYQNVNIVCIIKAWSYYSNYNNFMIKDFHSIYSQLGMIIRKIPFLLTFPH